MLPMIHCTTWSRNPTSFNQNIANLRYTKLAGSQFPSAAKGINNYENRLNNYLR